ncbi:hypothetical protein V6255_14065 [Psychromonas arctica]|uniref:Sulfotransferase family protein n=1 Tax=Psychromonas arctica TaxID=168275 RepID=A0ABU9HEC8_9GAMM
MHKLIYSKSEWSNTQYRFHLDNNVNCDVSTSILAGWFVNLDDNNYVVRVIDQAGLLVNAIEYSKNRPKLAKIYSDINDVSTAGFEIDMRKLDKNSRYSIAIFNENELITKVLAFVQKTPLLYIHIAKTAGSTVNKVLRECFGTENSLVHAESIPDWPVQVKENKIDFLSGHIPYQAFIKAKELQCYKKAITFREPYSHVVSHLSWIRALALDEHKKRYDAHPEYIQKLSDKLASYDLSSPEQVSHVIKTFNGLELRLLDNTQTRYIRTNLTKLLVDEVDIISSLDNLKSFDFVGTDNDIDAFLSDITKYYGVKYENEGRRENVLSNKFGLDISNLEIKKALLPLVKFDLDLYLAVLALNP